MNREAYEELKEKYGEMSSWAIWKQPTTSAKSNTGDLSVFNDDAILEKLNPDYVFVGLNCSSTHGERHGEWHNFHSDYRYQNDYKLRHALNGTKYWGAYITDIIKMHAEVDSNKVARFLSAHPEVVEENISLFEEEINLLGTKPVLIAMGDKTYEILCKYLGGKYVIVKIKHYSYTIGMEEYRKDTLSVLNSIEDD